MPFNVNETATLFLPFNYTFLCSNLLFVQLIIRMQCILHVSEDDICNYP